MLLSMRLHQNFMGNSPSYFQLVHLAIAALIASNDSAGGSVDRSKGFLVLGDGLHRLFLFSPLPWPFTVITELFEACRPHDVRVCLLFDPTGFPFSKKKKSKTFQYIKPVITRSTDPVIYILCPVILFLANLYLERTACACAPIIYCVES